MSATISDLLTASVVLLGVRLLDSNEGVQSFKDSVDAEVDTEQLIPLAAPSEGQQLTLRKDRITINTVGDRSVVQQEYPTVITLQRLAEVAGVAVSNTKNTSVARGVGYNVELVYDQDSVGTAAGYIADRLFADFDRNEGWKITGGRAGIGFVGDDETVWNVVLEPRRQDAFTTKVFLSINLHRNVALVPQREAIAEGLRVAYEAAVKFVNKLDSSGQTR